MSDHPAIFLPVDAAYDRWSACYDTYDNPMVFMASQALRASLSASESTGAHVFEFGCGTGRNLAWKKSMGGAEVAGCDLSQGMLDVARERCPGARVFQHDMTKPLPSSEGCASADLALFCLTLEHVADLALPLAEARRILRPGGRIAIFEIHPFLSLDGVAAHFQHAGQEVRMPTVAHCFADYLQVFAGLDLHVARCREWRPRDVGEPPPVKALKRGPDFPLVVEFSLERRFA